MLTHNKVVTEDIIRKALGASSGIDLLSLSVKRAANYVHANRRYDIEMEIRLAGVGQYKLKGVADSRYVCLHGDIPYLTDARALSHALNTALSDAIGRWIRIVRKD